jgi:hypothetical protein
MKLKLAFIAAVSVLGLAFATPAFAYGPNAPTVTSSASSVGTGGSLTVSGTGFVPDSSIMVTLHSSPVTLAVTTADPTGAFSVGVTIPSDTTPGTHAIIATDPSGDSASTTLVVTGSAAAVGSAAASPSLPFTGADVAALSGVGAIAMALGGMLILTGRRRRVA